MPFLFAAARSAKLGGYMGRAATGILLNYLDCKFDLIRLLVGVELDEGLDVSVHDGGTGFDEVLFFDFLFRVLAPKDITH